jgi:transcriptional regulator with XRE-family HTH domain
VEALGKRIAKHRASLGWTQQELADRVAISRVALSHVESALTVPGERTVALLSGVFGLEPHELVDGTDYPVGKADRLPLVVARHTEVEHQLGVLDAVLDAVERTGDRTLLDGWPERLADLRDRTHDPREAKVLSTVLARLREPPGGEAMGPARTRKRR